MKATDLAWVAGFLDGDGCITMTINGRSPYPYVSLTNTDKKVLRHAQKIIGGDNIHICNGNSGSGHNKLTVWALAWRGWDETKRVLNLIEAHLILKRKQANIILTLPERKLGRGAKKFNTAHWDAVSSVQALNSSKGRKRLSK